MPPRTAAGRPGPAHRWQPATLAAVALGGALGAPARYGVARWFGTGAGGFPWATLCVNVAGSFALGVLLGVLMGRPDADPRLRPFLATGFLGAFTTWSTFAVETDLLIKEGAVLTAAAFVAASLATGPLAAWAGVVRGRRRFARPGAVG